jgi:glycosyltransferase involved in cell wall biosynthesis
MNHFYINGKFLTQPLSGVQRYAAEISKHLSYLTTDFSVVTSYEKIEAGIIPENNMVRIGQKTGPLWEQFSLPTFLNRKHRPLLLNLCNMAPVFYKNKIVCIHDISFIRNPSWFSTSFYRYYKTLIPLIIKSSKHLITVSEFSRSEIIDYYKIQEDKISVIPGGIASAFLPSDQLVPASISLQRRPFFLFVGSIDPRKNLLTLL